MEAQPTPAMRIALVLLLLSAPSQGEEPPRTSLPPPELVQRGLFLANGPGSRAPEVYVAGQVATVLRFERWCDPVRTRFAPGWGSRFEPLMVARGTVVLVPIHDIAPEDRILLLVVFEDGSEVPFIVTARNDQVDHQVNVFRDPDSQQAMRWLLADTRRENWKIGVENERYRREALSPDHALAGLLVAGAEGHTPFIEVGNGSLKGESLHTSYRLLRGKGKVAVVLKISNKGQSSWKIAESRLVAASGVYRSFALRMDRDEIAPGTTGSLAVVVDRSAFLLGKSPVDLTLKIFFHGRLNLDEIQTEVKLDRNLAFPMKPEKP